MRGDGIRKKNGHWTARWTDVHGERHEKVVGSCKGMTRAEAREKRARLVVKARELRLGIYDGDPEATFGDVWKAYEPLAKPLANWVRIEQLWRLHIEPELGDKKVRQVSRNDVKRLLTKKAEEGQSPRSCEHIRMRLVVLYNFAAEEGIYKGENVASAAGRVKVPKVLPRFVEAEHVQSIIDAVEDEWRNFFALALYTGLRSGELRALRRSALTSDLRGLLVSRSGGRDTTKTNEARFVPIPREGLPYLIDALRVSEGSDWVFTNEDGDQLTRDIKPPVILRRALEKLGMVHTWMARCINGKGCGTSAELKARAVWHCPKCGRAGKVQPQHELVFHDLRKTFGTHFYELSGDLRATARLLGHGPEVANSIYVASQARRLSALADRLDFKRMSPSFPRLALEANGSVGNGAEATDSEGVEVVGK